MNIALIIIITIALVALYMYYNKGTYKGSKQYTIYGSMGCPWTVKSVKLAKKLGHAFDFVDCKKGKCPSFVNGFPTIRNHASGNIAPGFTEDPLSI